MTLFDLLMHREYILIAVAHSTPRRRQNVETVANEKFSPAISTSGCTFSTTACFPGQGLLAFTNLIVCGRTPRAHSTVPVFYASERSIPAREITTVFMVVPGDLVDFSSAVVRPRPSKIYNIHADGVIITMDLKSSLAMLDSYSKVPSRDILTVIKRCRYEHK
jgi:hypothetical protein